MTHGVDEHDILVAALPPDTVGVSQRVRELRRELPRARSGQVLVLGVGGVGGDDGLVVGFADF